MFVVLKNVKASCFGSIEESFPVRLSFIQLYFPSPLPLDFRERLLTDLVAGIGSDDGVRLFPSTAGCSALNDQ